EGGPERLLGCARSAVTLSVFRPIVEVVVVHGLCCAPPLTYQIPSLEALQGSILGAGTRDTAGSSDPSGSVRSRTRQGAHLRACVPAHRPLVKPIVIVLLLFRRDLYRRSDAERPVP